MMRHTKTHSESSAPVKWTDPEDTLNQYVITVVLCEASIPSEQLCDIDLCPTITGKLFPLYLHFLTWQILQHESVCVVLVLVSFMCFDKDMYLVLFAESTSPLEFFFFWKSFTWEKS